MSGLFEETRKLLEEANSLMRQAAIRAFESDWDMVFVFNHYGRLESVRGRSDSFCIRDGKAEFLAESNYAGDISLYPYEVKVIDLIQVLRYAGYSWEEYPYGYFSGKERWWEDDADEM